MIKCVIYVKHYRVGWVGKVELNGVWVASTLPHEHHVDAIDPAYWLGQKMGASIEQRRDTRRAV